METTIDIEEVTRGYIEAALWADAIHADPESPETGGLNDTHNVHEDDERAIREQVTVWVAANEADCLAYADARDFDPSEGSVWDYLGHDLRLTAEGHGAGFWDRGLGDLGQRLTAAAKAFGTITCWEEDSGVRTNGLPTVRFDV